MNALIPSTIENASNNKTLKNVLIVIIHFNYLKNVKYALQATNTLKIAIHCIFSAKTVTKMSNITLIVLGIFLSRLT